MKSFLQPIKSLVLASIVLLAADGLLQAATVVVDADHQYEYAQHLFQQGHYLLSGAEYLRFAHFFSDDPRARSAVFNAGRAYFHAGDLSKAIVQFQSLTKISELDAVASEAYFMLAECHVQAKDPGRALIALHNIMNLSQDQTLRDRALLRMGWIHIDQLDWSGSRRALEQISPAGKANHRVDELIAALNTSDSLQLKSPALAGTLSIIPGLGQLYCGRYEDALIAFIVDAGLFWSAYESFDNDLNVMGSLLTMVGIGFYASNIYSAVSSAHKYNTAQKHHFVDYLQQNFDIGLKSSSRANGHNLVLTLKFGF